MQNATADRLVETFTHDYFEKLFYFCLKRTGSTHDAEELTSEVSLAILTALRSGTVPQHFSAWVWQIARNRYSHWADRKRRRTETVSGTDLGDFGDLASDDDVEGSLIHSEELSLLRRELAFISADYRDVVVAFYIEDRKVSDIARSLHLSEGTVKSKLFRSRNILKEGMNMAREFGTKSYKPENVRFSASGSQPSGLPWTAVQRQIPKNILLEASNNPSTLEELSVELGIAMPYMEEEVAILERATLLKKVGNKYITNFFIQDKDTQHAVYKCLRSGSIERSAELDQIIVDSMGAIRALGVVRNGMSDNDLKWWLIPHTIDMINDELAESFDWANPVVRENGETWGFVGYEATELPESTMMGHNGTANDTAMFWAYKISDYNMWDRAGEMKYEEVILLGNMVKHGRKPADLTQTERSKWEGINGKFAHLDENGKVVPDMVVLEGDAESKLDDILRSHPLFEQVKAYYQKAHDGLIALYKENSNPLLHEQLAYYAAMDMCNTRMMAIHDEVNAGRLTVPADPEKSTVAMSLMIK